MARDSPDAEEPGRGAVSPVSTVEKTPGTRPSFLWRAMSLCSLARRLPSVASSVKRLITQDPLDCFFMCQLTVFGLPFLYVQSEILLQILGEFPWAPTT